MNPFFATILGRGPQRRLHWEHWSNPDAETFLTGIDHYAYHRQCRLRLKELYPQLNLPVPETDTPLPRPRRDGVIAAADGDMHTVRWGDTETGTWEHGEAHFHAFARLPINWVLCHDDIVNTRGPVCSPAWMRRHIFPRYEEYWGLLRAAGKQVVFMADDNLDRAAEWGWRE